MNRFEFVPSCCVCVRHSSGCEGYRSEPKREKTSFLDLIYLHFDFSFLSNNSSENLTVL